jgi:hypothetical protein
VNAEGRASLPFFFSYLEAFMVLPSNTFRKVLDLPKVDWSTVSDSKRDQVAGRCVELLQQLPLVEAIEGIQKLSGAKYLYEQALLKTLDALGVVIEDDTRTDLLIDSFLS